MTFFASCGEYREFFIRKYCIAKKLDHLPCNAIQASLDSGVNEYLVGQRWQCVRLVPSAEMAASAVCSKKGVKMVHD